MRQMFSSPRLENVEGVNTLFQDAGIETKITQGRTYRGNSRREFSYHNKLIGPDPSQYPAVWVIRAADYKKAREILHEAGLLQDSQAPSYLPDALKFREPAVEEPRRRMLRIKLFLLAVIGAMSLAMMARYWLFK